MVTLKQNIFILQQTMQVGREERRKVSMILFRRKFFDFIQTIDLTFFNRLTEKCSILSQDSLFH